MKDRDDVYCGHWCLCVVREADRLTENNNPLTEEDMEARSIKNLPTSPRDNMQQRVCTKVCVCDHATVPSASS